MVSRSELWLVFVATAVLGVTALNGPNVCMVKQKYNITKRVKYRAPMSVRTYEWCLSIPPRCSKWNTEMRDLTRLETEERIAEVAVCCPGYKMKEVSCVPICPNGKTGSGCREDCPPNKWGPNCVNQCRPCDQGSCSPINGECLCQDGWQGESCGTRMPYTTTSKTTLQEILTTNATTFPPSTKTLLSAVTLYTPADNPTTTITSLSSTSTSTTAKTLNSTFVTERTNEQIARRVEINKSTESTTPTYRNESISSTLEPITFKPTTETTNAKYNRTDLPSTTATSKSYLNVKSIITANQSQMSKAIVIITTEEPKSTTPLRVQTTKAETTKSEYIRTSTMKFKHKEIWIRPAQKGDITVESKVKSNENQTRLRSVTLKDIPANTTPKTIIVSIIPTSVSYATYKKILFPSATHVSTEASTTEKNSVPTTEQAVTKPMTRTTTHRPRPSVKEAKTSPRTNVTNILITTPTVKETSTSNFNGTNSMTAITVNKYSTYLLTSVPSTYSNMTTNEALATTKSLKGIKYAQSSTVEVTEHPKRSTSERNLLTAKPVKTKTVDKTIDKANVTKTLTKTIIVTTERPEDEETFHILTEPEHITAVMGDKGTERSSVDLISVISIAGGIMMAVITVAVVIVMIERCKKPRYDDVRKMNDIHMQVMIDNNDVPPAYVRSIFHTPLPDPPNTDKCHYQPISSLDRNLKQFMRPVVVQTISPIMLENFRGILECHYDHLPRRSHEFATIQTRRSITPSIEKCCELDRLRASMTEATIDALKCEAELDVIDSTASEPLYAEIPYWRPPSEHAVEIMNTNGEAVTEL